MNSRAILISALLFHTSGGQAAEVVNLTKKMLIDGVSNICSQGICYQHMYLKYKGISYVAADTFMDFPNITVCCISFRHILDAIELDCVVLWDAESGPFWSCSTFVVLKIHPHQVYVSWFGDIYKQL